MSANARTIYELGMEKYVPKDPFCVMLGTDNPLLYPDHLSLSLFQEGQYFEPNGKKYMQGVSDDHHITLKYGILPEVEKSDIEKVLERWNAHTPLEPLHGAFGNRFEVFGPPNAEYEAVVVPIVVTDFLYSIHCELNRLPNVSTFDFNPHITVGYFKKGFWETIDPRLYPPLKVQIGTTDFTVTGGNNA